MYFFKHNCWFLKQEEVQKTWSMATNDGLNKYPLTYHWFPIWNIVKIPRVPNAGGVTEGGFSATVKWRPYALVKDPCLNSNQSLHASKGHLCLLPNIVTPNQSLQLHQPLQCTKCSSGLQTTTKQNSFKLINWFMMVTPGKTLTSLQFRSVEDTHQIPSESCLDHNRSIMLPCMASRFGQPCHLHRRLSGRHGGFCGGHCHRKCMLLILVCPWTPTSCCRHIMLRLLLSVVVVGVRSFLTHVSLPENPSSLFPFLQN